VVYSVENISGCSENFVTLVPIHSTETLIEGVRGAITDNHWFNTKPRYGGRCRLSTSHGGLVFSSI
jgi:hypothetical protein